jgi:hypothetical protein
MDARAHGDHGYPKSHAKSHHLPGHHIDPRDYNSSVQGNLLATVNEFTPMWSVYGLSNDTNIQIVAKNSQVILIDYFMLRSHMEPAFAAHHVTSWDDVNVKPQLDARVYVQPTHGHYATESMETTATKSRCFPIVTKHGAAVMECYKTIQKSHVSTNNLINNMILCQVQYALDGNTTLMVCTQHLNDSVEPTLDHFVNMLKQCPFYTDDFGEHHK